MATARHARPKELEGVSIDTIMERYVARFADRKADWAAFEDAKIEGFKRAQHRFIGAGGSGKHGDTSSIPAGNFTLSIMFVPPGQGNPAHTHEVEECFFVLQGYLDVFVEDESGQRVTTRLGPWDCISCPAVASRRPWVTPTTISTSAATRTSRQCEQTQGVRQTKVPAFICTACGT